MSDVEVIDAFRRLMDLHQEIGSRIPGFLRPPVMDQDISRAQQQLGIALHPDLAALYKVADGVDEQRWYSEGTGDQPQLLPSAGFPQLGTAVESATSLREVAAYDSRPDYLWRQSWFPVLDLPGGGEALVVDCGTSTGEVWIVRWEADEIKPIAPDIATLLGRGAEQMRHHGVTTTDDGYALVSPPDPPEGWY